jgi:hypothetical protein
MERDGDDDGDEPVSLLAATVWRPALLLAFCRHIAAAMPAQMPGAEPAIFESLAVRIEQLAQCRCAHCHVREMAAVVFWWMAMHHDGIKALVRDSEPAQSLWRRDEFLDDLFAYAGAHVLRIKNSPITPRTLPSLARVFYHAMRLVLQEPTEYTMAVMRLDGAERTQKVPKKKKPRMRRKQQPPPDVKPLSPAAQAQLLRAEARQRYLAAGCRYTPRSKSKKAAAHAGQAPAGSGGAARPRRKGADASTLGPAAGRGAAGADDDGDGDGDGGASDDDLMYMDSGEPF